eukprot:jgi/Hompol1/1221/HPOL_005543-RA
MRSQLSIANISTVPADGLYPLRYGSRVPLCQVVLLGEIEREFILFTIDQLKRSKILADIMKLVTFAPFKPFVERLRAEGVRSVMFLEKQGEQTGKVTLRTFNAGGTFSDRVAWPLLDSPRY